VAPQGLSALALHLPPALIALIQSMPRLSPMFPVETPEVDPTQGQCAEVAAADEAEAKTGSPNFHGHY
jgi:hypothetical protein